MGSSSKPPVRLTHAARKGRLSRLRGTRRSLVPPEPQLPTELAVAPPEPAAVEGAERVELGSHALPADVTPIGERAEPVADAPSALASEPADDHRVDEASRPDDEGDAEPSGRQADTQLADADGHGEQQGSDAESQPPSHPHDEDLDGTFFSQPPSETLPHDLAYDDETTTGRAKAARAVAAAAGFEARRARLRRIAAVLVGAMGLVAGGALARRALAPSRAPVVTTPVEVAAAPSPPRPAIAAPPPAEPASAPVARELPIPPELSDPDEADAHEPAATATPSATAAPAELPKATTDARDPARAKALRKQLVSLLHRSKNEEAIPVARAAIAADPTDAMGYLYLGAAMQELRRFGEERATYDECVRTAKRNGVDQCRALGGRKRR